MRRILLVAQREFAVHARSRFFLLGLLTPTVLMIGLIVFLGDDVKKEARSGWPGGGDMRWTRHADALEDVPSWQEVTLVVTDAGDELGREMSQIARRAAAGEGPGLTLSFAPMPPGSEPEQQIKQKLQDGMADGWLVIPEDLPEGAAATFYWVQTFDSSAQDAAFALLNRAVLNARLREAGLSVDESGRLAKGADMTCVAFEPEGTEGAAGRGQFNAMAMGYAWFFMFFMFMGIFGLGQHMLTGLIEEKNSRVIEVLLSAVSPQELMAGKVLGLAAAGLAALASCGAIVAAVAHMRGLIESIDVSLVVLFVVYYVLGFLLASSVFAAVGSVCSQVRDMQGFMLPVSLLFLAPVIAWWHLASNPDGPAAVLLSLFPPTAPMAMVLRVSVSHVPAMQIGLSLALLALADVAVLKGAGRIFRTGILMYGKPPRLREMLRWAGSD